MVLLGSPPDRLVWVLPHSETLRGRSVLASLRAAEALKAMLARGALRVAEGLAILVAAGLVACAPSHVASPSAAPAPPSVVAAAPSASVTSTKGASANLYEAAQIAPPGAAPPKSQDALASSAQSDSPPASPALELRLREHYSKYVDGTRFDFFLVDFAPRVERYLALHDVEASKLQAEARRFFHDKKRLSFAPKPGSLVVKAEGARTRVQFVLTMAWSQGVSSAFKDCEASDRTRGGSAGPSTLEHKVDVQAELVLDEAGRFVSYAESGIIPARLKVETQMEGVPAFVALPTQPARNEEPTAPLVPNGTIVEDLGDAFTCSFAGETDTVRKVRVSGKVVWLLSEWTWFTGRSYVGEDLLRPVP